MFFLFYLHILFFILFFYLFSHFIFYFDFTFYFFIYFRILFFILIYLLILHLILYFIRKYIKYHILFIRDRGNYAAGSEVMRITYDYSTAGHGPLSSVNGGAVPDVEAIRRYLPKNQ